MTAQDEIGKVFFVHGQYLQDWMADPTVYSWRSDPAKSGPSSALADIGSHWCDLAEHMTGKRITAVLADLTTVIKTRYSGGASAEAFSHNGAAQRIPVEISGEDLASVLVRFDDGAKGCLSVGQVLPGHKNGLQIELNGRKASLRWNQERQNELWIGRYDQPNSVMAKEPPLMLSEAAKYAHLPAGHQEGWTDAFRNVVGDIYEWIQSGQKPATVCTFADAQRICVIIETMLKSYEEGCVWQSVDDLLEEDMMAKQQEAVYET
jgi:predicted dehydrogenase